MSYLLGRLDRYSKSASIGRILQVLNPSPQAKFIARVPPAFGYFKLSLMYIMTGP